MSSELDDAKENFRKLRELETIRETRKNWRQLYNGIKHLIRISSVDIILTVAEDAIV